MNCINCNAETSNPRFCSRSCSASHTNANVSKRMRETHCPVCNKPKLSNRKYCSKSCRDHIRPLKVSDYSKTKKWRHKTKQQAVDYKGGKCILCGYDKCLQSLDFHHLDASQKEFGIASAYKSLYKMMKEVDKCILVCSNCHGEIHAGLHQKYLVVKDLS